MAKTYKDKISFNGDWTLGEAAHHIGKKTTTKTHKSEKDYNRKDKSWKRDLTIS
jgi:hypothetical protein